MGEIQENNFFFHSSANNTLVLPFLYDQYYPMEVTSMWGYDRLLAELWPVTG